MKNKWIALCFLLILQHFCTSTCLAQGPEAPPLRITPAITRVVIDSLGQVLEHHYVFPDTAAKMAAYLDQEYKKGAYDGISDPQVLGDQLQHDLQKAHHDGHLHLRYAPRMARELSDTNGMAQRRRIGDSLGLIDARQRNFMFTNAEILPGNIGYVKINGFVGYAKEARPTFTGAFRFVANTKALIIDMRDNGGGSPRMVCQVASYFFPDKKHWNDIVSPRGKSIFYTDPADADSLTLSMPVFILTSKRTFSGGEDFCYGMKSLRRATLVGDTTGGGAHPTGPVPITLGFVADVPSGRSLNPYTLTDWEGTGVYPDIPVAAAEALGTAKEAIFKYWAQHATNEQEKNAADWQLDDLAGKRPQRTPDAAALAAYCGTYEGGLVFYVDSSRLYCRNAERGGGVFRLYPISGDKFVLDENVHVEFKKGDKSEFQEIVMLWSNGMISNKHRVK